MKLKQLAAVAAVVCSAPAFAGINTLNGDAEVFAIVWDEAVATYAIDFGITVDALLNSTGSFTLGTVGGSTWTSYANADANRADYAPFSGTRWAIVAFDNDDQFSYMPGDLNFYSTSQDGLTPTIRNEGLEVMLTVAFETAARFDQNGMGVSPALNGSQVAFVGDFAHVIESPSQPLRLGNAIGATTGLFGCTYDDFRSGTSAALCGALQNAGGNPISVSFDGTTFSVSAVPEPGTYAMLLAGLSAVGMMVRRRRG